MGAIISLFAAFYYWSGKILGYQTNGKLAYVHFGIFLIAINLVFFPMHFLGLNGMPRRIPTYSHGYAYYNEIMTMGSILTAISVIFFLYIVSNALFVNKRYHLIPGNFNKFINFRLI